MKTNVRRTSTAVCLVVVLLSALAAPIPGRAAGAALGAETPEKLVERMRRSAETKDFRELASCLAPEPRKELAQMIWLGATMMIGMATTMGSMAEGMGEALAGAEGEAKAGADKPKTDPKLEALAKRYDDVAKKHGLPGLKDEDSSADPAEMFAKIDAVEVVGDFGALLDGIGEATGEAPPAPPVPAGKLEGLKIEGDKASASLDGEPITFVKIDGRWFIAELPKKPEAGE